MSKKNNNPTDPPAAPEPEPGRKVFIVESVRPVYMGTIEMATVVLRPPEETELDDDNPLFRITLNNLTKKAAAKYKVGSEVNFP